MDHFSAVVRCETIDHNPIVCWKFFHESVRERTGRSLRSWTAEVGAGGGAAERSEFSEDGQVQGQGRGGASSGVLSGGVPRKYVN